MPYCSKIVPILSLLLLLGVASSYGQMRMLKDNAPASPSKDVIEEYYELIYSGDRQAVGQFVLVHTLVGDLIPLDAYTYVYIVEYGGNFVRVRPEKQTVRYWILGTKID